MKNLLQIGVGHFFGYLSLSFFSSFKAGSLGQLISIMIIKPHLFLFGSVCFCFSFIFLGNMWKKVVEFSYNFLVKRRNEYAFAFFYFGVLGLGYVFLFTVSKWVPVALLLFSLFYGMISLETNKDKKREEMRSRGH